MHTDAQPSDDYQIGQMFDPAQDQTGQWSGENKPSMPVMEALTILGYIAGDEQRVYDFEAARVQAGLPAPLIISGRDYDLWPVGAAILTQKDPHRALLRVNTYSVQPIAWNPGVLQSGG